MSEIPTRRYTSSFFIGLFVLGGTIILIGIIIWFSASQFMKENVNYVTYFDGSVEGLEVGSPVKYLGVPVGTVKDIGVAEDGRLIEVVMSVDKSLDIKKNLRVKSELAGIAGGKFLQLYYPDDTTMMKLHPQLNFKPKFPLIMSAPSGIQELEIAAREIMNNLLQFQVKDLNDEAIRLFRSTSDFFSNEELYGIIAEVNNAGIKLNSILQKVDTSNFMPNLEKTSQMLYQATMDLAEFSDKLGLKLEDLKLKEHLDNAFLQVDSLIYDSRNAVDRASYQSENVLYTINETLQILKRTNADLRKSLNIISDHPSQILLADPPPPEK